MIVFCFIYQEYLIINKVFGIKHLVIKYIKYYIKERGINKYMSKENKENIYRKNTLKHWEFEDKLNLIEEWSAKGCTLSKISENMGIGRKTLWTWEKKSEHIRNALRAGDSVQVEIVKSKLIERATGYNYEEHEYRYDEEGNRLLFKTYQKHMPADVNASKVFLFNKSDGEFVDKVDYSDNKAHEKLDEIAKQFNKLAQEK